MEDTRTRTRALDDMMVTPGPGFPGGPFPPMHRVPVFSTIGRGPRGKQGDPPTDAAIYVQVDKWMREHGYANGD